jgi:hypothetical protein
LSLELRAKLSCPLPDSRSFAHPEIGYSLTLPLRNVTPTKTFLLLQGLKPLLLLLLPPNKRNKPSTISLKRPLKNPCLTTRKKKPLY